MRTEKKRDDSEVREGVDALKDERLDEFMDYEERSKVWDLVAHSMGTQWDAMDRKAREKMIKNYVDNIIVEVKTMAGGIWDHISTAQKRELFRARFIDSTVVPKKRQKAFEGVQEKKEVFPDMDNWLLKNRSFMFAMTRDEREAAYRTARLKWEKEHKT